MLHITLLRWMVRTYCSKMLRIAWKIDDEYQKKYFYMSNNAPVYSSHQMFSHRITTFFGFFGPVNVRYSVNIIIFGRCLQTNLMLRHIAQSLIETFVINNRFLHLLILKVRMFKLETLNNMLRDL